MFIPFLYLLQIKPKNKGNKIKTILLATLILAWPWLAHAKPKTYGDAVVTRLISVYDGDTFRADIEGHPEVCGKNMPVRIHGIDTPELRTKSAAEKTLAKKAREFTRCRN